MAPLLRSNTFLGRLVLALRDPVVERQGQPQTNAGKIVSYLTDSSSRVADSRSGQEPELDASGDNRRRTGSGHNLRHRGLGVMRRRLRILPIGAGFLIAIAVGVISYISSSTTRAGVQHVPFALIAGTVAIAGVVISSLLVNSLSLIEPTARWGGRRRIGRRTVVAALAALVVGTAAALLWRSTVSESGEIAKIVSPSSGEAISRPTQVEVRLEGSLAPDHWLWLGFQNELGGPFIIQAPPCSISGTVVHCGPLYVGPAEADTSEYRIFLLDADAKATEALRERANGGVGNVSQLALPSGVVVLDVVRHISVH